MKLQYSAMGSMGTTWIDCQDRFDEFLERAVKHHGHTKDKIINDGLLNGVAVSTGSSWDDAKIRDADSLKETDEMIARKAEEILRKSRAADNYGYEDGE